MKYRQLLEALKELPQENLDNTATIYKVEDDEYFAITGTGICDDGVLDDGHPFLII
jgi:hypothetical protein